MGVIIQLSEHTSHMNSELLSMMNDMFSDKSYSVAYIASETDKTRHYFNTVVSQFEAYGNFSFDYFDFDLEYDKAKNNTISDYDIIYLSGGRTYYFLASLKQHKVLDLIKNFSKSGGTIIGLSAGSILLTQSIDVITLWNPSDFGQTDLSSLDLLPDRFVPHWGEYNVDISDVVNFNERRKCSTIICKDGGGVVYKDGIRYMYDAEYIGEK